MNSSDQRQSNEAGFTLIEALAVIAIMAIAVAVVGPVLTRPSERLALATTSREIAAVLRLTRSAAITTNSEQLFLIDVQKRSFGSSTIKERPFPEAVQAAFKVAEPERYSDFRGGIRFFADGSSTGGELLLSHNSKSTALCVHWLTGRLIEADRC
jgi:general secretion pathway protein H